MEAGGLIAGVEQDRLTDAETDTLAATSSRCNFASVRLWVSPMKRKRLLRLAMLALLGIVGFSLYLWYTSANRRINRAAFDRIREGMSLAEVEEVIGCPPGNYAVSGTWVVNYGQPDVSANVAVLKRAVDESNAEDELGIAFWGSNSGVIYVCFHRNRVWLKDYYEVRLE